MVIFFLNSNFRNLIINVGASTSKEEVLNKFGKRSPPVIHISGTIKQYSEDQSSIINSYKLMILNPNKKQGTYKIEIIDNDLYTHSIHDPIFLDAGKKKIVSFNIRTSKMDKNDSRSVKQITLRAIDVENLELFVDEKIGFILKGF